MSDTITRQGFRFTYVIRCPTCGAEGVEVWQNNSQFDMLSRDGQFIRRSGEFYERVSKKWPHPHEVVCRKCGAAQQMRAR